MKQALIDELRARSGAAWDGSIHEVTGVGDLMAHVRAQRGWTFVPRLVRKGFLPLVDVTIADFSADMVTSRIWRQNETRPAVLTVLAELRAMQREAEGYPATDSESTNCAHPRRSRTMRPRLELRQVRSFAAVAQWGSFGRAAAARRVSQPALSRQPLQLGQDLRVRLFERGLRGTTRTPAAETFRHDVTGLLASVDRFHNEVLRAERGTTGVCMLGVVPHAHVDRIVSRVLESFRGGEVQLQVSPRALTTMKLGDALRKSELDAAITYTYPMPVAQMDGLERRSLFSDELRCALLPANHPLADRGQLTLQELVHVPFLFPRRAVLPRLYDAVMQQFAAAGVTPRVDAEYEGVQTIWSLTARGIGWSLGTALQLSEPPRGTRCVALQDFYLPWGVEVVYRQDDTRASVLLLVARIIDAARTVVAQAGAA